MAFVRYEYLSFDNEKFFTIILTPEKTGKFPSVIMRSPYVKGDMDKSEEELLNGFLLNNAAYTENGYAVVFQHCRGRGKSSGAFIPYVHEREDGLFLLSWVRSQSFYNGEIYLSGGSYTASLHYTTAPFSGDIKGAVFDVQDSERYRLWYRNGQMRRGHANWHFDLYKDKCGLNKCFNMDSFSELPIKGLSERVLSDRADDFEEMLDAPLITDSFWQTRNGGAEARDAVKDVNFPVLLTSGYNDFYIGGMFRMWEEMTDRAREKSAFIVSPYNHGQGYDKINGIGFECATVAEKFGGDYRIKWFNAIRKKEKPFVETGKITYYRTFEDKWDVDFYKEKTKDIKIPLGSGEKTIFYNPENPPAFNAEGIFMKDMSEREDVITLYTEPFSRDAFVKGQMKACLTVSSSAKDTSFYIMVGIETENGDYSLRHDITSILYQKDCYVPGEKITLDFSFDEYAFLIKKGGRLRIDIAPTDKNTYVCHTNIKGKYSEIEESVKAENKVFLDESYILLPVEVK